MPTPPRRFESTPDFPESEIAWRNPFYAIDAEQSGIMPPASFRSYSFEQAFPQAELITTQVADWIATHRTNPDDNPIQEVVHYKFNELAQGHTLTNEEALAAITRTYVESNDELFWEETKSPDASLRLDDCDFHALAWYFAPDFEKLQEVEGP